MKKLFLIFLFISNLSFAGTLTWQGDESDLWSTGGNWDTGSKPVNGDLVILNNNANCQINEATANLGDFDMTGYTGTLSGTGNLNVVVPAGGGKCKFAGTVTWTGTPVLGGTGTITLTNGGVTTFNSMTKSYTNRLDITDAISMGATKIFTLTNGSVHFAGALDTSGVTHSFGKFASNNTNTRSIYFGNSIINLNGTGTVFDFTDPTNLTFDAGTSTVNFTDASVTTKTFAGGGKTFYNVSITGGGTGTFTISGSNTFTSFTIGAPKTVIITATTTQAFTSIISTGTAVNGITLQSSSAGSAYTFSDTAGTNRFYYTSIKDCTVSGGATWYAFILPDGCTNVSGNGASWIWYPPVGVIKSLIQ